MWSIHLYLILLADLTPASVSCPHKGVSYGFVLACGDGKRLQLPSWWWWLLFKAGSSKRIHLMPKNMGFLHRIRKQENATIRNERHQIQQRRSRRIERLPAATRAAQESQLRWELPRVLKETRNTSLHLGHLWSSAHLPAPCFQQRTERRENPELLKEVLPAEKRTTIIWIYYAMY